MVQRKSKKHFIINAQKESPSTAGMHIQISIQKPAEIISASPKDRQNIDKYYSYFRASAISSKCCGKSSTESRLPPKARR